MSLIMSSCVNANRASLLVGIVPEESSKPSVAKPWLCSVYQDFYIWNIVLTQHLSLRSITELSISSRAKVCAKEKNRTVRRTTTDTKSKSHKCPHCPRLVVSKTGLGSHGIQGSAYSRLRARQLKQEAVAITALSLRPPTDQPADLPIICPD
jgi:hypothetical protein